MKYKTNHEYKDLKRALRVKRNRLKARILSMLENNNNCLFLTFTFNNRVMKATTQETREKYIKRYLKIFANKYILNIDYGANTKREHYHAIATPKYHIFLYDMYNKKYGFINGEIIGNLKRFANINKSLEDIAERLTSHSTKESTDNSRIIYSRYNSEEIASDLKNKIDIRLDMIEHENERIKAQKRIDEETTEEEIKHPTAFYYINDQDFKYVLIARNSNKELIYKATKHDINGFKENTIIYNENSIIYKRYLSHLNGYNQEIIIFE